VLNRYDDLLTSSPLQFGFKAGYSTSMCSMILKETLEYYRHNKSTVYCTMLDATKAFDRVEYCKLVRLLLNKKLPAVIIRVLLHMYLLHFTKVAWNGTCSRRFRVLNGVRQGAILSPILFCVYFDTLLCRLSSTGIGCHMGSFFVGALAYADDLVLVAPSSNAMRRMLQICDEYAAQYNVVFNAKKSKCLHCHPHGIAKQVSRSSFTVLPFYIGSQVIEFVDKWPHLGHIISNDCADTDDILNKKHGLVGQINKILCNFRNVNCKIKIKLVKAYCTSFYGAELWDLSHNDIESICTAWRTGIRRIWQVPNTTHSVLIPGLCESIPLLDMFYLRMLKFAHKCIRSESSLVNYIVRRGIMIGPTDSIIGRNILNCSLRYHVSLGDITNLRFQPCNIYELVNANEDNLVTTIARTFTM
jgi:Reverse transcriptase (RNA-dependent DNA polymerase)